MKKSLYGICGLAIGLVLTSASAVASNCKDLPNNAQLRKALTSAKLEKNGGFGLNMWATVVNRDGFVCAVAFSGPTHYTINGLAAVLFLHKKLIQLMPSVWMAWLCLLLTFIQLPNRVVVCLVCKPVTQ